MLRKTLNSSLFRFISTNRRFVLQIVKSGEELVRSEELKGLDKSENNVNKGLIGKEKNELSVEVVRSGAEMDGLWELNATDKYNKEYNKNTDWYGQDHKKLNLFYYLLHHYDYELNYEGIKKRLKNWISYREENQQKYVTKRHTKLGPDLAIANFVVHRGGRVRFRHAPNEWANSLRHFPDRHDYRYRVITVDASNLKLRYDGIDNFVGLESLEELNLSNNKLDDWSCDKIGRLFRDSNLSALDLSDNPLISHRGIETLHRVRSLRTLRISRTEAANYPFIELLTLCFNDLVPNCRIIT